MTLFVASEKGELIFTPAVDENGKIIWNCINGEGITVEQLPPTCTQVEME